MSMLGKDIAKQVRKTKKEGTYTKKKSTTKGKTSSSYKSKGKY